MNTKKRILEYLEGKDWVESPYIEHDLDIKRTTLSMALKSLENQGKIYKDHQKAPYDAGNPKRRHVVVVKLKKSNITIKETKIIKNDKIPKYKQIMNKVYNEIDSQNIKIDSQKLNLKPGELYKAIQSYDTKLAKFINRSNCKRLELILNDYLSKM